MPRFRSYGRAQATASHIQLRKTQGARPRHVGVARRKSLMANEVLYRNNDFTDEVLLPVQILSQIYNQVARDNDGTL